MAKKKVAKKKASAPESSRLLEAAVALAKKEPPHTAKGKGPTAEMDALRSLYVTIDQLLAELYGNDTITGRDYDHLVGLLSVAKNAIDESERRAKGSRP